MELVDLVETLRDLNEKKVASDLLSALGRHSTNFRQYDEVAKCFFKIKRYKEAVPFAEKALADSKTNEQKYAARSNLVNVYAHAYEPEKGLSEANLLLSLNPDDEDIRLKKAYCLFLLGNLNAAEKILREELKNSKNSPKVKNEIEFNLGTYELYKDNFQEGLYRFLIHGRKMDLWKKPQLPFTEWDTIPKPGHMIVIRAEAGIGDEFINIRFMKHFEHLGMIPVWYTDRKETKEIFNRNGFVSVNTIEEVKDIWNGKDIFWCHSMDVPILLKLEYKDLWYGSYLKSDEKIVSPIKKTNKLKIGLRWQGNPDYDNDLHRSVPLAQMYNCVKHLDADVYSLQRDTGAEDVYQFPEIVPLHENHLKTFEETLAIIADLDIVITTCTSIAHASAAMGKRTYVFSPMSSYYIWCHSSKYKHSPWYAEHVTLLRQKRPRYWDEPIDELKQCLIGL
jgi:hypothetical protein